MPVSNQDRPEAGTVLESAGPALTSIPSLPYYTRPTRPARPEASTVVLESFAPGAEAQPTGPLLDVAAASFGSAPRNADTPILEAVIGDDDRTRVTPAFMLRNPWRQICALRITSKSNRTYVGTGWFIAPGVLATAGHCVYLQDDGGWAKSIRVIPAKEGTREPLGSQISTRYKSVDGWVKKRSRDMDYGVIFLDDKGPGTELGNFSVQALDVDALKRTDAQISGYPADLDRAEFQYFHLRPMLDVTDAQLIYDIDTFGGQSGSPIWQQTAELGLIAVGIHTTGGVSSNSGTRINRDVLDNLVTWVAE